MRRQRSSDPHRAHGPLARTFAGRARASSGALFPRACQKGQVAGGTYHAVVGNFRHAAANARVRHKNRLRLGWRRPEREDRR
jgi:hypothetical protein